jgi:hypothetical protein
MGRTTTGRALAWLAPILLIYSIAEKTATCHRYRALSKRVGVFTQERGAKETKPYLGFSPGSPQIGVTASDHPASVVIAEYRRGRVVHSLKAENPEYPSLRCCVVSYQSSSYSL